MKKATRKPQPKKKKPTVDYSIGAFERSFKSRLGQKPSEFIENKLSAGSDVRSVNYLYDISAAAVAEQFNCVEVEFDFYYKPIARKIEKMKNNKIYNKLVRDKIPEFIESSGKKYVIEYLDKDRYIEMLDTKLQEELSAYQESKSLGELADLLEVMGAVVKARGYSWEELTSLRKSKREKYGAFENRILLKEIVET